MPITEKARAKLRNGDHVVVDRLSWLVNGNRSIQWAVGIVDAAGRYNTVSTHDARPDAMVEMGDIMLRWGGVRI